MASTTQSRHNLPIPAAPNISVYEVYRRPPRLGDEIRLWVTEGRGVVEITFKVGELYQTVETDGGGRASTMRFRGPNQTNGMHAEYVISTSGDWITVRALTAANPSNVWHYADWPVHERALPNGNVVKYVHPPEMVWSDEAPGPNGTKGKFVFKTEDAPKVEKKPDDASKKPEAAAAAKA